MFAKSDLKNQDIKTHNKTMTNKPYIFWLSFGMLIQYDDIK